MSSESLSDFPDRLPPMLVKELRQGLRAKTFVAVFLSFQAVLAVILLSASASGMSGRVGSVISGVIFTFFAIAVMVVQPLRGIAAVSSEVKSNTLDMMVLTKLSASRIVFGKWFALVSQSALLLATVIPYLIFRYFLGQMNLVGEIVLLLLMFLTSMAVTALTVGFSASSSIILRVVLPLIGIPILGWTTMMFIFSSPFGRTSTFEAFALNTSESRWFVLIFVCSLLYLGWSSLSMGTSIISPAAENHATRRRLITLLVTIVTCGAIYFTPNFDDDLLGLVVTLVALPALTIALTERSFIVPKVLESFDRFGFPGKFARLFLCPGWPSGVFFSITIVAAFFVISLIAPQVEGIDETFVQSNSVLGALLFPAVIVTLFRVEESSRTSAYVLILAATFIFTVVMTLISESLRNEELLWFFIWSPSTLIPLEGMHASGSEFLPIVSTVIVALYSFLLLLAALFGMKSQTAIPRSEP